MRPFMLISVVLNMREQDREEQRACNVADAEKWALSQAARPGLHFAAVLSSGEPVACFGFNEEHEHMATMWAIATDKGRILRRQIFCAQKSIIQDGIYRRCQAFMIERADNIRAAEYVGLRFEARLKGYLHNGSDALLYATAREAQ